MSAFTETGPDVTKKEPSKPGKGRPKSERDDATTKFDRILLAKAKVVAASRGIPVAEYLSELCRGMIDKDSARFVRDVDKRDGKN